MSIQLEDFPRINEECRKAREKVISVLGENYFNSNHYGHTLLFNKYVSGDTSAERIKDIYNKYKKLCCDIKKIFNDNGFEVDEDYLEGPDMFSGQISCLNVPIDVDAGIEHLKPAIEEYITLYNKVLSFVKKYNITGQQYFSISNYRERYGNNIEDLRSFYYLYGQKIYAHTEENVIEEIIGNFSTVNIKVNSLLKKYKYNELDILVPCINYDEDYYNLKEYSYEYKYILFNQCISINTTEEIIEEIIKNYINLYKRVYKYLNECNYKTNEHSNILLPVGGYSDKELYPQNCYGYSLFNVAVYFNTTDEDIITIINLAKKLEENIEYVAKRLNITNFYVEYGENIYIKRLTGGGVLISLRSTKEELGQKLIECCCRKDQFILDGKKMVLVKKDNFEFWLMFYKELPKIVIDEIKWKNESGWHLVRPAYLDRTKPSVKLYIKLIEEIMKKENINTWTELTGDLNNLLKKYSNNKESENFSNKEHIQVINALNLFKEFLIEKCDFE